MSKSFGENLKLLMQARNLSASRLAKEIGVSPKTVLEWIGSGGRMPRSPEHIRALTVFFNVSTHQILFGEEDPKNLIHDILDKTELHTGLYEITVKRVRKKGEGV